MAYAERRLAKCPYGQDKPTCAKCPVHCYKAEPREQARQIMRYAGPRMTWRHPVRSLVHLFDKLPDQFRIFDSPVPLDAAADVDAPGCHPTDRRGDIGRR